MSDVKVRSIVIDTLTEIQTNEYMTSKSKASFDKWRDYGMDIYSFILKLQPLGFELIMVLGEPGTGKSSGMRTLPHNTNIWYNADNKNPVWTGGRTEYGTKVVPRIPYHVIPRGYDDIIEHIKGGLQRGMFEELRFAFLLGHVETYKAASDVRERLKTLGNLANKMNVENKLESVFYSRVEIQSGKPHFLLETQNNGSNTARSPQEVFDTRIENDYNLVVNKLIELQ